MKLKPCPFCGGDAELERLGTMRQSMIIACLECGGRMESGDVNGMTPSDRWAWNRRETDQSLVTRLRELAGEWRTGTIGSPFGLEGIAGMRQGMERCADALEKALEDMG